MRVLALATLLALPLTSAALPNPLQPPPCEQADGDATFEIADPTFPGQAYATATSIPSCVSVPSGAAVTFVIAPLRGDRDPWTKLDNGLCVRAIFDTGSTLHPGDPFTLRFHAFPGGDLPGPERICARRTMRPA